MIRKQLAFAVLLILPVIASGQSPQGTVVTLPPDKLATGPVQIVNGCRTPQTFQVKADPEVPWIRYTDGTTADVGGGQTKAFNITLSSYGGMKPGEYKTAIVVTCTSCGSSTPPCGQDRKLFPVTLVIPGDDKPQEPPNGGGGGGGGGSQNGGRSGNPPPSPNNPPVSSPPQGAGGNPGRNPTSEVGPINPKFPNGSQNGGNTNPNDGGRSGTGPGRGVNSGAPPATTPGQGPQGGNPGTTPDSGSTANTSNGGSGQPSAGDSIPDATPTTPPLLPLAVGGLLLGGAIGSLLTGLFTGSTPSVGQVGQADGGRIGQDTVPQGAPTRGSRIPGDQDVVPRRPDQGKQDPDTWDATFQMPAGDSVGKPGGGVPTRPTVPVAAGSDRAQRPNDDADAWDATFAIATNDYIGPTGARVQQVSSQAVKLQPAPPYPGSHGGLSMPLYPPGREPRLYVNPRTGEQRWIMFGHLPPDGWVPNDGFVDGTFDGPGSDYVEPSGRIVRLPDGWVKLQPTPPLPGAGGPMMPEYLPGREPALYVDPKTGEQRWVMFGERPPAGWARRSPLQPLGIAVAAGGLATDVAPKQVPLGAAAPNARPAPPPPMKSTVEEMKPPVEKAQPAQPALDHVPGDLNEGGGHTFSRGTTPEALKKANTLTAEELAAAKRFEETHRGPARIDEHDEYAQREKAIRDNIKLIGDDDIAARQLWRDGKPPIAVDLTKPDTPYQWQPFVPKTELDQQRIDFVDKQIAAADAVGNTEAKKFWSDIKRQFGWINQFDKPFLDDLDDLRTLAAELSDAVRHDFGPSLQDYFEYFNHFNFLPGGRSIDDIGHIAGLRRRVTEHHYLLYLYRTKGERAVQQYRQDQAKMAYYQGVASLVDQGVQMGLFATMGAIDREMPAMPDTRPRPEPGAKAPSKGSTQEQNAASTPRSSGSGSGTVKYTPEEKSPAGAGRKEPTVKYTPEEAGRLERSEAVTQKGSGDRAKGAGGATKSVGGAKPQGAQELTPEEKTARQNAVDEDWKQWQKEDAEARAQGKDAVDETFKKKKYTFLPREEEVPAGRRSPGVPAEENPYRPLTPAEKEAWKKSVADNWQEWENFAKEMEAQGKDPVREWFRQGMNRPNTPAAKPPAPVPPQKNIETKEIRGGDTTDLSGGAKQLPETRTRVVKPAPESSTPAPASSNTPQTPPESATTPKSAAAPQSQGATPQPTQAAPMKLPGQKGIPFGPRKAVLDKYGPAVEKARADAGGPTGSCEKAKLSLLDQLEGTGAHGEQQRIGPLDHEVVFTKDGHVLDPVARQVIEKNIATEEQLAQRGLLKAVNDGIFTREQWEDFKRIGGRSE